MKRSLAVLLRKLANRLDPPPTHIWKLGNQSNQTASSPTYRLTFLP